MTKKSVDLGKHLRYFHCVVIGKATKKLAAHINRKNRARLTDPELGFVEREAVLVAKIYAPLNRNIPFNQLQAGLIYIAFMRNRGQWFVMLVGDATGGVDPLAIEPYLNGRVLAQIQRES